MKRPEVTAPGFWNDAIRFLYRVDKPFKVGTADATLGTNNSGGRTGYVLVWEKDGISHTIIGKIPREEILKIAESIS